MAEFDQLEGLLRIVVAGLIGVLVGLEREAEHKPAGMRTYGGVAMGAATFTVVGILAFGGGEPASRVAAQIITGIGFLGAGTILHMRGQVVGLTTAAGLWMIAAMGMAIGSGLYVLGIGAGIAIFVLLQFLRPSRLARFGIGARDQRGGESDPAREADDE
jgi:putative Mg2+ transporter-C (MgtC) family protein